MIPFKVLFVGEQDWANLSMRMVNALNWVTGKEVARSYVENRHPFGYRPDICGSDPDGPEQLERVIRQLQPRVDWVIYGGDGGEVGYHWFANFLREHKLEDQPRGVRHAGSAMRNDRVGTILRDREMKVRCSFAPVDLYGPVGDIQRYVPYIPPTNIGFTRERPQRVDVGVGGVEPLCVMHIPSHPTAKGTGVIRVGLEAAQLRARLHPGALQTTITEPGSLSNQEAQELRQRCHVYVDQIAPEIGGYGVSAIDAMGMGAVVLADVRNVGPESDRFFAPAPIKPVADEYMLEEAVWQLCQQPSLLADLRRNAWEWSRNTAGYDAQGRYILQNLWARAGWSV